MPSSADCYVELKNFATGNALATTFGAKYHAICQALYGAETSLQSYTRTHVAKTDNTIIGHISCIPYAEYVARRKESSRLTFAKSHVAGCRNKMMDLRRSLNGTTLGPWRPDQLYIESIAVMPHARRLGVATMLLTHANRLLDLYGCRTISLDTKATNRGATALYYANGFRVDTRKGNHLKLSKSVENHVRS